MGCAVVGDKVGSAVGLGVGPAVGTLDGLMVGVLLGLMVGTVLGEPANAENCDPTPCVSKRLRLVDEGCGEGPAEGVDVGGNVPV